MISCASISQVVMNTSYNEHQLTSSLPCIHDDYYYDQPIDWSFTDDYFPLDDQCSYNFNGDTTLDEWDNIISGTLIEPKMLPPALHPNVTPPPPPNYVQTIELNHDDHTEADVTITKHVTKQTRRRGVKNHSQRTLELEDMQKYFHVPITVAAKEMKVGLTVLKRRCRELKITRWPHRKIKSLKLLIKNVKEMGLMEEMVMLEEDMMLLLRCPDMELSDRTKRLRQACFKANYKKRRLFQIMSN